METVLYNVNFENVTLTFDAIKLVTTVNLRDWQPRFLFHLLFKTRKPQKQNTLTSKKVETTALSGIYSV